MELPAHHHNRDKARTGTKSIHLSSGGFLRTRHKDVMRAGSYIVFLSERRAGNDQTWHVFPTLHIPEIY